MITIRATTFAKRKNSTAVPGYFEDSYEVALKDSCSYDSPVFLLNERSFMHNYVEWSGWFYFVSDVVVQHNNLLEVHCTLDPLGTFRDAIRNSTQFVAYDTTPNTEISDKRLSTKTTVSLSEAAASYPFDYIGKGYSVVLNVVGIDSCVSFAVTVPTAINLINEINTWSETLMPAVSPVQDPAGFLSALATNANTYFRQMISSGSAVNCIRSCCVIPISFSILQGIFGTAQEMYLGQFNTHCNGVVLGRTIQDSATVPIPWPVNDWRRNEPYCEVLLYVPFLGTISLPSSSLVSSTSIIITASMDVTDGTTIFTISLGGINQGTVTKVIGQYNCNLSADYAIGSSNMSRQQAATVTVAAAGVVAASVMTGGVAAVMAGTAGIVGEYNAARPVGSTIGSNGGGAILGLFGTQPRCMVIFHDTVVAPESVSAIIGTPTMAVKSLSGLSGYVECRNAHVSIDAHDSVMNEIDSYLNGGVYLE